MTDAHQDSIDLPLPRLDQFNFHQLLADMTGITLVMFTSPDCGGCRHLRRVLIEVQSLESDWQLFEVDAQADTALINEFEVFHLPTILLFLDGTFHCQLQAEANPSSVIRKTNEALQRPAQEAP